jgi:putative tryptophan/tyrosine transport system substrate-binding protein
VISAMKRRDFITLLGGAAAWPLAARGQQPERVRRVGALMGFAESDPEGQIFIAAFREGLHNLGWTEGRNIRFDTRWAALDPESVQRFAKELVALQPDLILSHVTPTTVALLQQTRTIPIIFVWVSDPVGSGFVASLARPGGNATGFTTFEYGLSGKWVELLNEIAPGVKRVAVLRDAGSSSGIGQLGAVQSAASSFGMELSLVGMSDAGEIEHAVTAFARAANGGVIVTGSTPAIIHRELITTLAARYRLPAVYGFRYFVTVGGLISYGPGSIDPFRRAAGYVDRVLKGEKPADLPVQAPTKYDLVINLKTAKALGLTVPDSLLARADEVIE